MLKFAVAVGVWTNAVEAYSHGNAGRGRWENRGEEGRQQVAKEEMLEQSLQSSYRGQKKA